MKTQSTRRYNTCCWSFLTYMYGDGVGHDDAHVAAVAPDQKVDSVAGVPGSVRPVFLCGMKRKAQPHRLPGAGTDFASVRRFCRPASAHFLRGGTLPGTLELVDCVTPELLDPGTTFRRHSAIERYVHAVIFSFVRSCCSLSAFVFLSDTHHGRFLESSGAGCSLLRRRCTRCQSSKKVLQGQDTKSQDKVPDSQTRIWTTFFVTPSSVRAAWSIYWSVCVLMPDGFFISVDGCSFGENAEAFVLCFSSPNALGRNRGCSGGP